MLQEAQRYKDTWQVAQRARVESSVAENAFVYAHFHADDDQPFYVGIGYVPSRPWQIYNRTKWHKNVVEKHGVRVSIITDSLTWEQAIFWEVWWIKALRAAGYELVNLTDGGDGTQGYAWSEELRERHKAKLNSLETKTKRLVISQSLEMRELRKINTQNNWQNPIVREARCVGIKKALRSSEYKERRAELESKIEIKKLRRKVAKEVQNRPEVKILKSERAIAQWQCPIKKQNHKRAMENPEVGRKISEKKLGVLRTETQKANISAGQQAFQNSRTSEEKALSSAKANETKRINGTLRPNRTTEENSRASKKAWITRRKNQLLKKGSD